MNSNINPVQMKIESLQGLVENYKYQLMSAQNLLCLAINKLGNPVIFTEKDVTEMPNGNLVVTTDKRSGDILVTFEAETTKDTKQD
jgi:hypothetical protein